MRLKNTLSRLTLFLIILFVQCKTQTDDKATHSPFNEKVTAFTSGQISANSKIVIELASPVDEAIAGEKAPDELLTTKPEIKGELKWAGDRTLVLSPKNNLPSGTEFRAEIDLPYLYTDEKEKFFFTFNTIKQESWLGNKKIYPASLTNYSIYSAEITLQLADVTTLKSVEENVIATFDNKKRSPQITRIDNTTYNIKLNNLQRGEESKIVEITIKKGELSPDKEIKREISISGIDEFKIISANLNSRGENIITVSFSNPVDPQQDLSGLFLLGGKDVDWQIDNNMVLIYPDANLQGIKELVAMSSINDLSGNSLGENYNFSFSFTREKPQVEIIGDGNIMPLSNDLHLPFKAVSLDAILVRIIKIYHHNVGHFLQNNSLAGQNGLKSAGRLIHMERIRLDNDPTRDLTQWNNFSIDLANLIEPDAGSIYRVELGFEKGDSNYNCDNESDEQFETPNAEVFDVETVDGDFWDNPMGYYSTVPDKYRFPQGYSWRDRDNPCSISYYTSRNWDFKNIVASDLGISAKQDGENNYQVTLTNLISAIPIEGVEVELYNLQMVKCGKGTTNSNGLANIEVESKPYLLIAQWGDQKGYLRMTSGSSLPVDRFDVSGEEVEDNIKGYIFGERGVWRPGDSLFISFMPIFTNENELPPNHPVTFELTDPRGRRVARQVSSSENNRLYSFKTKTEEDAPTGFYNAKVTIGNVVFNRSLRVETVRPNRLDIDLKLPDKILLSGQHQQFMITSEWLHGSPAAGLKSDVKLNVTPVKTTFEKWEDFNFDDPATKFDPREITVYDGELLNDGTRSFTNAIPEYNNAPGILSARFTTRVFEKGGIYSSSSKSAVISPYAQYAGIIAPQGNRWGRLSTNEDHKVRVAAVDYNGKGVAETTLDYEIYHINTRWWWESSSKNLHRYVSSRSQYLVESGNITTCSAGKGEFTINMRSGNRGRYLIRVVDRESGHATGEMVSFSDWGGLQPEGEGAEFLSFETDKKEYSVGDDITVTFPSTEHGFAHITVKKGNKILENHWVKPGDKETTFTFEATEKMTPNIYIGVTLIQPHAQTVNDLPIRLYGIVPAKVTDPKTQLKPEITTADEWRPDETAVVKISEENNREMDYVIAIVDEGLLSLTNFSTPNPWRRFNAREALGVKTWDLYSDVMGAFGGNIESLFSIGGDADLDSEKGENELRRFEPMVRFAGPFTLNRREEKSHQIEIPSYTGNVRAMVIATDGEATGSSDKNVRIKKPVMVWSGMPRVMTPGDKLSLPVTVFALENNINRVNVSVETSDHYNIKGNSSKIVNFDAPGDKTLFFEVETGDITGLSHITITAEGNGEKDRLQTNIEVRMPNPETVETISATIDSNESKKIDFTLPGIEGTNSLTLETSVVPPVNLNNRLNYLIKYPHGCIEQIASAAFPQLYLDNFVNLNEEQKREIRDNINRVILRLPAYQTSDGGFSYWPGGRRVNEWSSSYAGHFMLEAEKHGYVASTTLKNEWLNSQKRAANRWMPANSSRYKAAEEMNQAYRLYTLALAGDPATGAMNRLRQQDDIAIQARWLLALAYSMAGIHEVAESIIDNRPFDNNRKIIRSTYGSNIRDNAILVKTLSQLKRYESALSVVHEIADELNSSRWMSTQTTAWSLMSIINFSNHRGNPNMEFSYKFNSDEKENVVTPVPVCNREFNVDHMNEGTVEILNKGETHLFTSLILRGIPDGIDKSRYEENLKMEMRFETLEGDPLTPNEIEQGTDFKYIIRVHNPGTAGKAENLALTQMVPSAWEIRNLRLEGNSHHESDIPDYRDIRDDRVFSYFDLEPNETKQFVVIVHAAFAGEFYLPPASCEAMYNHNIRARIPGMRTKVSKP
ncbi:MG2 domain-containing protein [Marinilabiliaceae bacterium ANBcel2]|nr:MG2 domain-containing protein [Marinilabiliaceae bacterium ANBcel2]